MKDSTTIERLPMSLRTIETERQYQEDKSARRTLPLELEASLMTWQHWRMIENRYPYGVAYKTHHMLVPKRAGISDRWHLNEDEKREFEVILKEFVYPNYDLWFENCPKRRSITTLYHVHLATYVDKREDMQL